MVPASRLRGQYRAKDPGEGPITRKEVLTKKGEEMEFFTFEDKTGIFETVFFPPAFRRFCRDLDMSHAYLLQRRVEDEFEVVTLNVDYAYRVPETFFNYPGSMPGCGAGMLFFSLPEWKISIKYCQPNRPFSRIGPFHTVPYVRRDIDPIAALHKMKSIFPLKPQGRTSLQNQYIFVFGLIVPESVRRAVGIGNNPFYPHIP